jgi:hypothetical protein
MVWTLLEAMEQFAPNGIVRRRVKQTGKKYIEIIGEPTPIMQYLSKNILRLASKEYMEQLSNPSFYRPKVEPFKKYIYHKSSNGDQDIPYKTEWPTKPSFKVKKDMLSESFRYFALEQMMKLKRSTSRSNSDPIIDDYLMGMVNRRAFGFGL